MAEWPETIEVNGELRTVGRPDFRGGGMEWATTRAKRHPKYVYGTKQGLLLHEIAKMELQWWQLSGNGHYWRRVKSPRVYYTTKCGMNFFGPDPESPYKKDANGKATVCELPKPDAVLCGRCKGEPPIFAKGSQPKPGGPTRQEARARIGCVVNATAKGAQQ